MPALFELPAPLRTGNDATDKNFTKVFKRLRRLMAVSARGSSTLKIYPFGEGIELYFEYTPSSKMFQLWIDGESWGRWNVKRAE